MYIEELKGGERDSEIGEEQGRANLDRGAIVSLDVKRALVGAGGRALFYPTLLYNVVRNKIQSEFRWWDRVDEFILLGAVPFPADVPCLKELGVSGIVTLNEPHETLVPTSLYHNYNMDHLVIPTRDYLFAPSYGDIFQAVNFIHEKASSGEMTYVHCKAGRGRSTTIVLCYLVEHRQMTPDAAYDFVRSIRPRVQLASSQWQAVQDYYIQIMERPGSNTCIKNSELETSVFPLQHDLEAFDDGSIVMVTESDLVGYDATHDSGLVGNNSLAELTLACRVQVASQAAITRISCLWLRCHHWKKLLGSSLGPEQVGCIAVDISIY
ncbi:phosphatidylglycerophosphate phosphatase PTPMT2 [Rhododendron vialii]|uniref:phosphatidylglycerophosphate phosphatase PTPMT2 n=1 Tax=Rhododendron vialii TaxID=182163 RepID=UPI00265E444C|nr:phosphatidylglycerophosphate phosphatase PTPMT2 [Rhododendron vialii]